MSEDLFHRVFCLTSVRRLKNIIMIMEWTPHANTLKTTTPGISNGRYLTVLAALDGPYPFTPTSPQMQCLQKVFQLMNISNNGKLSVNEFKELVSTLDVPVNEPGVFNDVLFLML